MQDGPIQLSFARTNHRECGCDLSFGVDVADVLVPPHGVARLIRITATDYIQDVVVCCENTKGSGIVSHRGGNARPKLLTDPAFPGHYVTRRVAVADNAPANDVAGGPGHKRGVTAVSAHRLLAPCTVAILVDGKVSWWDSGAENSQRAAAIVELGGHEPLVPFAATVAKRMLPSHGWESSRCVKIS
ncbi:hypothetical protein AWC17_26765 [Mycobacterium nebraskense]|uniref:Uncharacterized protein n=1 Tax=Mycobacterium nebraskense TaxID=244292 RepID=A0A1X1ZXH1_9MYCO|nr:hypothetical protein ABW17_24715 [Mycobacterium nebraskense]ORV25837.1 hypothetical protein AWB97_00995 [Mycobacterium intracellulare subsp. chimaera]ORW29679.1 hypothetical protein AWC17_26765 [Mycobacterium nebraskense]